MAIINRFSLFFAIIIFAISTTVNSTEQSAFEEPEIRVVALFKNAAMVNYQGKQKLYRVGQKISSNIKLIESNTTIATFMIQGKKVQLGLDRSAGYGSLAIDTKAKASVQPISEKVARIPINIAGHYATSGTINGVSVNFLVDTGATAIAMNESVAKLIGIDYKMQGVKSYAQTAAGTVPIWGVTLNKVQVGGVELNFVKAFVMKGNGGGKVLLGMSFLNRVKMDYTNSVLTLTKQY
jgi:aspartyl protease family protein